MHNDAIGDVGGQPAGEWHGRVDGRERAFNLGGAIQQHGFTDGDVHARWRRRRLHLALDNQCCAMYGFDG